MKIFWKIFLASISIALGSCVEHDYGAYFDYLFVNNTEEDINITSYTSYTRHDNVDSFEIKAGDTMLFIEPDPWSTEKYVEPYSTHFPPMLLGDDSTTVAFGDSTKFVYIKNRDSPCVQDNSLYCPSSYSYKRMGDLKISYTYVFSK